MSDLSEQTRWLDATGQADLVRSGQVTALEMADAAIKRIEASNPAINAVVMRWFEHARQTAGDPLPDGAFRGVPFLLKDWMAPYAGQPLCNGNRRLKEMAQLSAADSTLVARFRSAGLVTLGRTNTPEFAGGTTTEPVAWGATHNPWRLTHSPGGSSGGAAAAVAAGIVAIAHGSDGSGSTRIPASCCGVVGLKPTQGRISAGPFGDESGPGVGFCISRTVRDVAVMLDAVHGPGVGDTVTAPPPHRPYLHELTTDPEPLRIGVLDCYPDGNPIHPDCANAVRDAAELLEDLGHRLETSHPAALADPEIDQSIRLVGAASMGATLAALAKTLGRPVTAEDVEPATWMRAELGRTASAADHALALSACARFRRAVHQWWADGFDILLTPTLGEPPAVLGSFASAGADPSAYARKSVRSVAFTRPFNITGQPAISLPLWWNPDGLPIGVHLVAAYGREDILIRVAAQLERARPFTDRKPQLGLA